MKTNRALLVSALVERSRRCLSAGLIIILSAACTGPTVVETLMECRSPTRRLNAIFWWQGGGGAAGWAEHSLTIVPADMPPSDAFERSDSDGRVLRIGHGYDLRLTWENDETLRVEYPETAVIYHAAPGNDYTPFAPKLRVTYRGVPTNEGGRLPGGSKCTSGNGQ
jgi:hypothetical protein